MSLIINHALSDIWNPVAGLWQSSAFRRASRSFLVMAYRIFFSHGGEDTYIVQLLGPKVETSGATVFLDAGLIKYGDDFRKKIFAELNECDELLVLLTP